MVEMVEQVFNFLLYSATQSRHQDRMVEDWDILDLVVVDIGLLAVVEEENSQDHLRVELAVVRVVLMLEQEMVQLGSQTLLLQKQIVPVVEVDVLIVSAATVVPESSSLHILHKYLKTSNDKSKRYIKSSDWYQHCCQWCR